MKLFFFSIFFLISAQHYDAGVTSSQQTILGSDITPCEEINSQKNLLQILYIKHFPLS